MTTPLRSSTPTHTATEFEVLVQDIRPELHRYCSRMIGSVVDAEDVVQEALAKAYSALPTTSVANLRAWLFRIAHNKAVDFLRRARQQQMDYLSEQAPFVEPDPPLAGPEMVAIAFSLFLQLAPKQRSCVILKDVLGYSLADISEFLDATIPEIKAALHRGRTRLRELSKHIHADTPTLLDETERKQLARYIEHFNTRDFDAVRAMLADEVRLDLVNRTTLAGRVAVGEYFHRYNEVDDWQLGLGTVEGRPAILVYNAGEPASQPIYFILLTWDNAQVSLIRDYRYASYVLRDAAITMA